MHGAVLQARPVKNEIPCCNSCSTKYIPLNAKIDKGNDPLSIGDYFTFAEFLHGML
jgi:hypothetical protein